MKIVHLCLGCFYIDNYSYQENLLPKFHKRLGNEVEIIASLQTFDSNGRLTDLPDGKRSYINENGIPVTRLDYRSGNAILRHLGMYKELSSELERAMPDILFIHGCQFLDMGIVAKYAEKHPNLKVFVDNHADYSNSASSWISKNILHRMLWKSMARLIDPYVQKWWGVLPARVDFLVENYRLSRSRCDLLVMAADDDEVLRASKPSVRMAVRERFGFAPEDFIIVTGGKIDRAKAQTILLMDAVKQCEDDVKLLVFGPIHPDLHDEVMPRIDNKKVVHVPWASTSESYDYFAGADLVVFPGRHSVYWEQAAGMGKPMVLKEWSGTAHVDAGGNVVFLHEDSMEEIFSAIQKIASDGASFEVMKNRALQVAPRFRYSDIALMSIGQSVRTEQASAHSALDNPA